MFESANPMDYVRVIETLDQDIYTSLRQQIVDIRDLYVFILDAFSSVVWLADGSQFWQTRVAAAWACFDVISKLFRIRSASNIFRFESLRVRARR
jgi:hypothetical protein